MSRGSQNWQPKDQWGEGNNHSSAPPVLASPALVALGFFASRPHCWLMPRLLSGSIPLEPSLPSCPQVLWSWTMPWSEQELAFVLDEFHEVSGSPSLPHLVQVPLVCSCSRKYQLFCVTRCHLQTQWKWMLLHSQLMLFV